MNNTIDRQKGTSLLETLIATAICAIAVFSLAGLITMAAKQSKNQGSTLAQSSTLAAQKLDELLGKQFTCTPQPDCSVSGTSPIAPDLAVGGDLTSNSTGYYEYLDKTGALVASGESVFYVRRWTIADEGATIKLITVRVEGRPVSGAWDPTSSSTSAPSSVLCSRKAMQ